MNNFDDFKMPGSKEEMEELHNSLQRNELSESDLGLVSGGAKNRSGITWVCMFCGATVMCKSTQDAVVHMESCPRNPCI